MNLHFASIVILFLYKCCASNNFVLRQIKRIPSDYTFVVSKDNLTCRYYKGINCIDVKYLLKSTDYHNDGRFINGYLLKKNVQSVLPVQPVLPVQSVPPNVWISRPMLPLKGRLHKPPNFYIMPQKVTQPYIIDRNIGMKNNNLFSLKHKDNYDSTLPVITLKDAIIYTKNNILLEVNDAVDKFTGKSSSAIYNTKFKNNKLPNDSYNFFDRFKESLKLFDRKFYQATFTKLISTSPVNRNKNGISFVQSGLFLYMALMTISTEVDLSTKIEIDSNLMYPSSVMEKIKLLKHIVAWLPVSNNHTKIRWASRLVVEEGLQVNPEFVGGIANSGKLHVEKFNSSDTKDNIIYTLNRMVEKDSGGAMRDTFLEDDFTDGFCSVFITTLYIRARWRVSPTVLNGTYPFKDDTVPEKSVQMIKLNDIMGYTELIDWNADAIEIKYALPGLTLLMIVPRENSIRNLVTCMETTSPQEISSKMRSVRIAATLPIYTLRMTLLLPGKLQMMNISRLVETKLNNNSKCGELRLSHAVQRLMFWAEAGRHAFKDDGIEWDETPEMKLTIDRPYIFYVIWKNVTLMNGNFVL